MHRKKHLSNQRNLPDKNGRIIPMAKTLPPMSVFRSSLYHIFILLFAVFFIITLNPASGSRPNLTQKAASPFSGKQPLIPMIYSAVTVLVYSSNAVTSAYTVSLFALA